MTQPTNKSTGLQTADLKIATGKAILAGVQLISDATNDVTLTVYDDVTATGTAIFKGVLTGTLDSAYYTMPDGGVLCSTGMFADISGTGAAYIVHYR